MSRRDEVLEALRTRGPSEAHELAEQLHRPLQGVLDALRVLKEAGYVVSTREKREGMSHIRRRVFVRRRWVAVWRVAA